jgi:hypothetical protein
MRVGSFAITRNTIGQIIPPGLHIPANLADFPYVPHPGQLAGQIPYPVLGFNTPAIAGPARVSGYLFKTNKQFRGRGVR